MNPTFLVFKSIKGLGFVVGTNYTSIFWDDTMVINHKIKRTSKSKILLF